MPAPGAGLLPPRPSTRLTLALRRKANGLESSPSPLSSSRPPLRCLRRSLLWRALRWYHPSNPHSLSDPFVLLSLISALIDLISLLVIPISLLISTTTCLTDGSVVLLIDLIISWISLVEKIELGEAGFDQIRILLVIVLASDLGKLTEEIVFWNIFLWFYDDLDRFVLSGSPRTRQQLPILLHECYALSVSCEEELIGVVMKFYEQPMKFWMRHCRVL